MDTRDTVRMANQIAGFFSRYGEAEAIKEIADHLNRFWEPRMRSAFFALVDAGGAGLDPLILKSVPSIRRPGEPVARVHEPKDRKTGLPKEAHEA